jgi:hypothetical protein
MRLKAARLPPVTALRRLLDNAKNFAPNQTAERADKKPVKPKACAARRIRTENTRFRVEANRAVGGFKKRKIPRGFCITRFGTGAFPLITYPTPI